MVTDVENSRLSRPAPISSGQASLSINDILADAARSLRANLFFAGFVVSLCVLAFLYALFSRGLAPAELEKALLVSSIQQTSG
jgi:hypothetical protein